MTSTVSSVRPLDALLFGLHSDLACELAERLTSVCRVCSADAHFDISRCNADVIFCCADTALIGRIRRARPRAAIVVVTPQPEIADWLDSIEAGATDYCTAPFETSYLKWIVEGCLRPPLH
jgi:DNA-binding NtrC family response regulator